VNAQELASFAQEVAAEAAALAMQGFRKRPTTTKKGAIDLLTEYDVAAEQLIRARISKRFPGHRIIGEEAGMSGEGENVWYVDPIDGTTNFVHGHPFFCTSIAHYVGDKPSAAAVVAPALGTTWSAAEGQPALRNGEVCKVSDTAVLGDALCATGFPYDRWTNADNNEREFAVLLKKTRGIRRCGSAAIDLCLVADGTYDVYWEQSLKPWDMCGGALIVASAGGRLTDYDGSAADPREGRVVASCGGVHDAVLALLKEARAEPNA
jgi:myo-inositol-1(or 4)-monophosphatase